MNFPQKRQSKFRVRLQVCVYLIILLIQEEEGNQLFRQLSVELWYDCSISYTSSIPT